MATAVASRFAVLSLDVEDDTGKARRPDTKKAPADSASAKGNSGNSKTKSASQSKQQDAKKKANKKKAETNTQNNAKKGSSGNGQQKQKSANPNNPQQWEDWKRKDQEFVSDSYEHDLQEAVLQSKLEFDEVCKVRKAQGLDVTALEKGLRKKNKPQKAQTMSLDQFNKMKEDSNKKEEKAKQLSEEDANFFEKINEFAAKALDQELKTEHFKARQHEPEADVHVTLAQFQNVLDKRNKEIFNLKDTVAKLEFELSNVKARNSKLCAMLAQGEMKDKVDVLLEVERLKTAREELLTEVQSMHTQLEQERSKVHDLTKNNEKQKSKNKK